MKDNDERKGWKRMMKEKDEREWWNEMMKGKDERSGLRKGGKNKMKTDQYLTMKIGFSSVYFWHKKMIVSGTHVCSWKIIKTNTRSKQTKRLTDKLTKAEHKETNRRNHSE